MLRTFVDANDCPNKGRVEVENTCLIPYVGHSLTSVIVLKDASRWKTCCDPMLRAFVDVRSAIAMCLRYA